MRQSLRIGGVGFSLAGLTQGGLPVPFDAFGARLSNPDLSLEVIREAPPPLDGPVRADGRIWRLIDDGSQQRLEFASPLGDWTPRIAAHMDSRWSAGTLWMDPAYVSAYTLAAPLAGPLGELLLMAQLQGVGLYVHGSAARWPDGVDVFLGSSGAGKTTLAGIAATHGARILSDDRTVLRVESGRLYAYGTPFHGTGRAWATDRAPVRGLFFLEKSPETGLRRLSTIDAAARLASVCFTRFWERDAIEATLASAADAVSRVAVHALRFRPDASAVDALELAARAA